MAGDLSFYVIFCRYLTMVGGLPFIITRERSKSRNNSKNHQWPSPTRVGIDAPRGERKKKKKLQEEKSVKNTSSTCSIIRKMPQKPTESDLKIWYSSISQNVRKLVVNRKINSQVPLVAEPHRGD